jgi:hypothetical protein
MDQASIINFLSNENTGKQVCFELAPGFFIVSSYNAQGISVSRYMKASRSRFLLYFGIFTISDKNDFYANAHESGRNHEDWEAILKDFLALSAGK